MGLSDEPLPVTALEVAFDAVPLPLALVDQTGTLRRVNPALAALLGYPEAELVGRRYADLTPAEDAPLDRAATQRLRDRVESTGSVEKRLRHRDGRDLWVRVTVTAVHHPDGTLWGGVARIEPLIPDRPLAGSLTAVTDAAGSWPALHDPLTGAANRLLLSDRITHGLAACERDGGVVAVLFCDLDDFKAVNDTFGHERGDQVLTAVVRRLQTSHRASWRTLVKRGRILPRHRLCRPDARGSRYLGARACSRPARLQRCPAYAPAEAGVPARRWHVVPDSGLRRRAPSPAPGLPLDPATPAGALCVRLVQRAG